MQPSPPFPLSHHAGVFTLANARLVLGDRIIEGDLVVEDGIIRCVGSERSGEVVDCAGDTVIPGLVDIHTDHFEKHVFPRAHVRWDPLSAALAHDAQMIGSGVTTVFDSICVGSAEDNSDRREILRPIVEAIRIGRSHGLFRAEHLLHLRCEVIDPETPALLDKVINDESLRVISVMDHTPGARQSRDIEGWIFRSMKSSGRSREEVLVHMREMLDRTRGIAASVRPQVVAAAKARNAVLLSHDDATEQDVADSVAMGCHVSEFPTTLEAAQAARAAGLASVAGAPNYLRGGSQSGNVAVRDLLELELVDILATDYVPRSMLDAAFRIGADPALPQVLPAAIRMVTVAPARAAGLTDRGELAVGQRADLLRVRVVSGYPIVVSAWREGARVG